MELWSQAVEKEFFEWALKNVSSEKLFYRLEDGRYLAYYPKGYRGRKQTLQSRNSFIGEFSETWFRKLIEPIAGERGLFAVQSAVCEEIELTQTSPGDVVLADKYDRTLEPENIALIFEIKISVAWNWEYDPATGSLKCIGDYTTHTGNPSLLRSDSMLKAIGKATNIRISSFKASKIPIFVVGNTPIGKSYIKKVDSLKTFGIVQGFLSVNPNTPEGSLISTPKGGFITVKSYKELRDAIVEALDKREEFFSGALSHKELGEIIQEANKERTLEDKARRFLELLRSRTDA